VFDNSINLVGNLTADPEFKVTNGGVAVVRFRLACSRRIFDRTANEWRDGEPAYFSVSAWRQLAQNIHTSLRKGDRAIVVGRMRQSEYEVNNERRIRWEVEAEAVGAELTWSYAQVQRARRAVADTQDPADTTHGIANGDDQQAGAEPRGAFDADPSYEGHGDLADDPADMDLPEAALV
jgi:single stranded DNA-binding protein